MTRPPRLSLAKLLPCLAAFGFITACFIHAPLMAQEAPATAEAPATEPAAPPAEAPAPATSPAANATAAAPNKNLKSLVGDFWHYGKIARYDLAQQAAQQILSSGAAPNDVLVAFEQTAAERKDNLSEWLDRWQNTPELKEPTAQLVKLLNEGRYTRRSSPESIQSNLERLATNERGYANGIAALRDSGELAVPFIVQALRDPSRTQYQPIYRRALRDLGRYALNPLVAATETRDDSLAMIVTSLGDLGYDAAVPYLVRVANDNSAAPAARKAAGDSIARILGSRGYSPQSLSAGELFYQLGEKFYYDTAAIQADPRNQTASMWYWDADKGLINTEVPPPIFNELMAMRQAEYAMKSGGARGDALSLWLASNYKREVELPQGATDPTRAANQPDAHYYGVSAGAQYLNSALARALKDRNAPVALKVIRSLQEIAGQSNALPGGNGPLVDAMQYPDRVVRFESAFALAGSLPQKPFNGQNRVVPLLAEALSQTGQPGVLIVSANQEQVNSLVEALKAQGYLAAGANGANAAPAAADTLPSVDVVVVSDELSANEIEQLINSGAQPAKLAGAAKLVIVKTGASPYEQRKNSDPMLSTTQATDAAGLKTAIDAARQKAGGTAVDPERATQYAARSADLLARLAISRGQVLDLSAAMPTLLATLNDARPDIVKQAGTVLGLLPAKEAQTGLLTVAGDDKTADDVKVSLYKSLATNAKFFGNMLDPTQIQALAKVVSDAQNLEVRSAAADAHGALNLPADQAKTLIVKQSKV